MGRPTNDPKSCDVRVRINSATDTKLLEYCKIHNMTRAEAVRQGIHLLLEKK